MGTPEERTERFLLLTLKDRKHREIARSVCYFAPTKELKLPDATVRCKVKRSEGRCTVTLYSSSLAKDVFIEIPVQGARFSDNFFDLLPGEKRTVTIESPKIRGDEEITVRHIRETYE